MNISEILSRVDHTQLGITATDKDIIALCDDAIRFGTATVCIPPSYIAFAKAKYGENLKLCTVIGFPNGYNTTAVKAHIQSCGIIACSYIVSNEFGIANCTFSAIYIINSIFSWFNLV